MKKLPFTEVGKADKKSKLGKDIKSLLLDTLRLFT